MSKSKRKSRHKNRRMRELAQIQRQAEAFRSGGALARRVLDRTDADMAGLHPALSPIVAICGLTLAAAYSKDAADKVLFSSAMPMLVAEAGRRALETPLVVVEGDVETGAAGDVHALLEEAKRWHEDP